MMHGVTNIKRLLYDARCNQYKDSEETFCKIITFSLSNFHHNILSFDSGRSKSGIFLVLYHKLRLQFEAVSDIP